MNKRWLILFLSFLLGCNIFLVCIVFQMDRERKLFFNNEEVRKTREFISYDLNLRSFLLNNNLILDNVQMMDNSNINNIKMGDGEVKLVARFSQYHCGDCVYYFLNKVRAVSEQIGRDNILLIGSYENPGNMTVLKKEIGIQDIQTINVRALNIEAEQHGFPYFFILNNNKISDVFFPEKSIPSLSNTYLDIIFEKYGFKK